MTGAVIGGLEQPGAQLPHPAALQFAVEAVELKIVEPVEIGVEGMGEKLFSLAPGLAGAGGGRRRGMKASQNIGHRQAGAHEGVDQPGAVGEGSEFGAMLRDQFAAAGAGDQRAQAQQGAAQGLEAQARGGAALNGAPPQSRGRGGGAGRAQLRVGGCEPHTRSRSLKRGRLPDLARAGCAARAVRRMGLDWRARGNLAKRHRLDMISPPTRPPETPSPPAPWLRALAQRLPV